MIRSSFRFKRKYDYKLEDKATFPRFLHLNPKLKIPTPKLTNLMDHIDFPVAISTPIKNLRIVDADGENLTKAKIIIDQDNKVHDIININNIFLDNQMYGNRMNFLHRFKDYKPVNQLIAYNFREIFEIAEIIQSPNDVVIKPLNLPYLKSVWTLYNENSVFSSYMSKNGTEMCNRNKSDVSIGTYLRTLGGKTIKKTNLEPYASSDTVFRWRIICESPMWI